MDQILSAAMAGTQRRAPRLESPLLEGLTGELPAQLLGAAALAGVANLAARIPGRAAALSADPQSDQRPIAPGQALQRILDGEFRPVFREWLELARQLGLRPDPYHLPQFLDIALGGLSPDLRVALGPRGDWLAAHNPRWAPILELSEGDWETGRSAARFKYLARLREAEPARALELLKSTWTGESAEDRLKAILTLDKGLSQSDEEFLEAALGDRSKGVRLQAAALLSRLPESRLSQRMRDRVKGWVKFYEDVVAFDIPQTCTADMERDGIEVRSSQGGERAHWLEQGVALAPLSMWGEPRQTAALAARSEWGEALLRGFLGATVAQGNVPWAGALLSVGIRDDALFAMLPNDLQDQLLRRNLGGFPPSWLPLHSPYSMDLGSQLLVWMQGRTAGDYDKAWTQALLDLSLLLPAQLSPQAEFGWPEMTRNWIRWRPAVEKLQTVLRFRLAMRDEMHAFAG